MIANLLIAGVLLAEIFANEGKQPFWLLIAMAFVAGGNVALADVYWRKRQ